VTRLLLVRHGESEWNAAGRWQGHADPPLTRLGERQAEAAVLPFPVSIIWSSPLVRARRTAEIIGDAIGLEVRVDARLQERDAGEWTGLTRAEIDVRWPGYLARSLRPDNFEPDPPIAARALEVLEEIAGHAESDDVLVISHGGLIRVVERTFDAHDPPVPNLGGRELVRDGSSWAIGERVLLLDRRRFEVTATDLV
jgi:broad specificity phosphatase PhoE